ncbi:MAG: hypothetical protein BA872_03945 [Desulfobacterales bacterium C00003060]|nr:MAG: hypothetical protein BA872_03945 [Desulfobacterales bacterium C00003060]
MKLFNSKHLVKPYTRCPVHRLDKQNAWWQTTSKPKGSNKISFSTEDLSLHNSQLISKDQPASGLPKTYGDSSFKP